MGTVTTLPHGGAFTRADLATMPDDGRRHELVDGSLVVTPAPSRRHQLVAGRLHLLLSDAAPDDLVVLFAPVDVVLDDDTVVQPDLFLVRREGFLNEAQPVRPLLAVEILSASTRRIDLHLKRAMYESAGCPSYWVVDPDGPSVTVFELHHGRYAERAHVAGDEEAEVSLPYPLTLRPADLVT